MTRDDMFAVWAGLVRKHTFGGACNFQNAANELAELAAAAEREACARVCEAESAIQKESAKFCKVNTIDQRDFDICAAAIRAKGNT